MNKTEIEHEFENDIDLLIYKTSAYEGHFPLICRLSGGIIKRSWLSKFYNGRIKSPGLLKVAALVAALERADELSRSLKPREILDES